MQLHAHRNLWVHVDWAHVHGGAFGLFRARKNQEEEDEVDQLTKFFAYFHDPEYVQLRDKICYIMYFLIHVCQG